MLIAMDPAETVDIVLSGYEGTTNPPTFTCRQFTARERTKVMRLVQQATESEKAGEAEKTDEALTAVFALSLLSWKNIADREGKEVTFDVAKLADLLTWEELWELYGRCWRDTRLSERAKKKYESAPESGEGPSAKTADADAKTATP